MEHENTTKDLRELVTELIRYEKKLSSLGWNFLRGITYGLGFFIGSVIVTAIVIYILNMLFGGTSVADSLSGFINTYNSVK